MNDKKGQFDGEGHESDPLTPIELRRFRHMFNVIDRTFVAMTADEIKAVQFVALIKKAWPFIVMAFGAGVAHQIGLF